MLWNLGGFDPASLAPPMLNAAVGPAGGLQHPNLTSQLMLNPALPAALVPNNGVAVPPATGMAPPVQPPIQPSTPVVSNSAAKGDMLQPTGSTGGTAGPLREAGVAPTDPSAAMQKVGSALSGVRPSGGSEQQRIYSPKAPEPSQRIDQGQLLQLVMSMMPNNIPGLLGGR